MSDDALDGNGPLDFLTDLRARLLADRERLDRRIAALEAEIIRQERAARASAGDQKKRRPRGANRRAIKALFAKEPAAKFTLQQIADATGLALSSAGSAVS